jgi:hypothetical protein
MNRDWEDGYDQGFAAGVRMGRKYPHLARITPDEKRATPPIKPKPKRKQSGKAAILTKMTKPVWEKYKKGRGKKTYVDIRSEVSKTNKYKRATKGM